MKRKIDDITAMKEKRAYDLVRDFMDDILPQIEVDAVPNAYLYALYCCWMEKNNPESEKFILGKNNFLKAVRKLIGFFPAWHIPVNQFRVLNYLDRSEKTLFRFKIEDWMQDSYASNPDIRYRLKWERPLMDGILRTKYQNRKVGRPPKQKCG